MQTVVGQTKTRKRGADKAKRSEAMIERDIAVYKRKMAGLSVRAICDEFGLKSTQTIHVAIQRGREYAKERGIDVEERRIQIDELFRETLGALAQDVAKQAKQGVVSETFDGDGKLIETKRICGVSPRTAGELSRSLHRWASFLGLCEVGPEAGGQSMSFIQLSMPTDGASLEQRWASAEAPAAVDVESQAVEAPQPLVEGGTAPAS
jgi:hypothetical protein